MKSNKLNFGKTDLQIDGVDNYPEITPIIQQTLARLMGFDSFTGLYRQLLADSDGRLLVSTAATQASSGNTSQTTIGVASGALVGANPTRKAVYIYNNGSQPIFINYGSAAVAVTSFPLAPAGYLIEDKFLGAINAIALVAGQDVRMLELS